MKKKLLAILLTVCIVISMTSAALAADSVFTDVKADDWFAEEVGYVYDNGLMKGVSSNRFEPDGKVTRAMMWTTLARLAGTDTTGSDPWWLSGQEWVMDNGISDGTMASENITREQLVTMLWRYAGYAGMDVSAGEETGILAYDDASAVSEWAATAMGWACGTGIINGINGKLQPQGYATRAQLAAILYRFLGEFHTVTFLWNYGDKGVYETVLVKDGQCVESLANPSRSGYSFSGWYTEEGVRFTLDTKVTEDMVVYAGWSEAVSALVHIHTYDPNDTAEGYHKCGICGQRQLCVPKVADGDAVICSVCGADYIVASEAAFEAEDLSIVNDGAGLESYGTVTLRDVTVKAGSPADYAVIIRGGTAELEDVNVDSAGGGVGVVGGAKVVFDGGSVAVNTTSTSGRYNFYVVDDGTELTIQSGDFSFSKTMNQKRAYIYVGAGATVYVEGGNFGPASTRSGYTSGIMGDGTVIITGGTFGFDPSNWVAEGYYAAKEGDVWTVKQCDSHSFTAEAGYHTCENCDFTEMCTPEVVDGGAVTCAVCGADYIVASEATFEAENVTINNDSAGVESFGSVTLKDVVMKAGSPTDYAVIIKGGEAALENVDVDSAGGGVGVVGGAKVVFDGGSVAVNTTSTSGRYNFYVVDDGTELTIQSGDFSFSKTLNQKRAYIYVGAGATVYVEGGNFGPASTRSGYTSGIMGDGTVIITGGTFGFDPSNWVAEGYEAVKEGSVWTVAPKTETQLRVPMFSVGPSSQTAAEIVNDPAIPDVAQIGETGYDTLQDALTAAQTGDTVKLLSDISFDTDDAYKANGSHLTMLYVNGKNITLDMNGKTISVDYQSTTAMLISVVHVTDGAGLTVTGNGTIDVAKAPVVGSNTEVAYMFRKQGTTGYLVIENGYYHMVNAEDSMIYTNGNEIVTVNGGTFVLDEVGTGSSGNNGCPWMFNCAGSNEQHVLVNGGSFNADITDTAFQHWNKEVQIADGMIIQQMEDGLWHVIRPNMSITRSGETIYFDTMTEAIAAAQDGDTIVLEQDIAVDETATTEVGIAKLNSDIPTDEHVTFFNVSGKNITVDLNGKQIYADVSGLPEGTALAGIFSTSDGGQLTLQDSVGTGVVEVKAGTVNVFAMIINLDHSENSSKIIIESGTYTLDRSVSAMIDTRCNEGIVINGGTFNLGNVKDPGLKNGQAWTFNAKGQNTRHVIVTGGTFPADIQHQYYPFEVSIARELALQYDAETGMYTVVPAVAYVNEQEFSGRWYTNEVGYATMEEAYAAVEPPKTSWDGQVSEQEYVTSLIADYYGSLADAFGETNALEGSAGASVSVSEEDGKKVVTLLDDIALTETLNIEEDATLVLNGHEITNGDNVFISPAIRTNADVVIDGTAEGSAITVNAPAGEKGTVLSAKVGTLTVNGGTYTSNTSGAGTLDSYNYAVYTYAGTELNVNSATILAKDTGDKAFTVGINAVGDAVLTKTTVIAEANYMGNAAGNNYGSASRGIYSTASLELYDCYIWGAHSGVTTTGSIYVDGGTYEGFGHGGFYLAGGSKTSYFYNATINWAPMRDGYEYDNVAGTNAAGMYISQASNIKAYFDGCKFNINEANGENWDNKTCPYYAVVINNGNNEVYVSNCYIGYASNAAFRLKDSYSGRYVYYGVGNTYHETNVERLITSGKESQLIDTNESYAP